MQRRKQSEAKRIENELNAKNQEEGKTEKVEVDVDSVDWLYGTYKLKGEASGEEQTKAKETDGQTTAGAGTGGKKLSQAEVEQLPVISSGDSRRDSDSSIFSTPASEFFVFQHDVVNL